MNLKQNKNCVQEAPRNAGPYKSKPKPYAYACWLLGRKDYTVHEIRTKLHGKKYDATMVEETIRKLTGLGFLNDFEFIGRYVRTRVMLKPRGTYLLKLELRKKGINENLLEEYFEQNSVDEVETAKSLLERNFRKLNGLPPEKRREKMIYLLRSRGFSCAHMEHFGI